MAGALRAPAPARRPALLRAAARLFVAAAAAAAALAAAEAVWRLAGADAFVVALEQDPDPRILFRLTPSLSFTAAGIEYRYNAFGMRGPAIERAPSAGVARVACVGDSFTFGYLVREEDSYPSRLGALLGPGYDVLNAGTPAYNAEQEAAIIERVVLPLGPRIVVWQWYLNDAEPPRREDASSWRRRLPAWSRRVLARSQLVRWATVRLQGPPPRGPRPGEAIVVGTPWTPSQIANLSSFWEDGGRIEAMESALRSGRDACRRSGVELLVVLFPPWMGGPGRGLGPVEPHYRRMRELLDREAVPLLDLTEAILGGGEDVGFDGDTHYAPAGYGIAAREIAAWIRSSRAGAPPG